MATAFTAFAAFAAFFSFAARVPLQRKRPVWVIALQGHDHDMGASLIIPYWVTLVARGPVGLGEADQLMDSSV